MCGIRAQTLECERSGAWAIALGLGRVTFDVRLNENGQWKKESPQDMWDSGAVWGKPRSLMEERRACSSEFCQG